MNRMVMCTLKGGSRDGEINETLSGTPETLSTIDTNDDFLATENGGSFVADNSSPNRDPVPMETSPTYHLVNDIKHDYYERPENLCVSLFAKKIVKDSLEVEFREKSVRVNFRTSDPAYLKKYPHLEQEDQILQWEISLWKSIVPERCEFELKTSNLVLKLRKLVSGNWGTLEPNDNMIESNPQTRNENWISLAPKPPKANVERPKNASNSTVITPKPEQEPKFGYTGLGNLGNTCYMNAVLQCLANTTALRDYFNESKFQKEINLENPLGFGGALALSFATILRQLWSGKKDSIEPSRLKSLLADRASQFSGFAQHDAQEFMAFLLDGLHEDLNRVKCKPLTTAIESDGRPDEVVANEAWQVYKQRNDSIIVDLFQGQYRSTLICPSCQKVSVTFDPFLYLSLPLPALKSFCTVTCFSRDPSMKPVQVSLWLDGSTKVEQLKDQIRKTLEWNNSRVQIIETSNGTIKRFISDQVYLSSLHSLDALFAFETLPSSLECPTIDVPIIQRLLVPNDKHTHCAACKKENSQASKLKRCIKCLDVSYCDRLCQRNHWEVHRPHCLSKPVVISQPFIVSLPKSELTYAKLYDSMLAFSRFFVDVTQMSASNQEMDSSEVRRQFFIKPSDYLGHSVLKKERLEDLGDTVLNVDDCVCLAMDWRNNELADNYCVVKVKPKLECRELDSSDRESCDPNKLTLARCLEQFMQSEVLSREEAWYCPRCKEHREATKQMSLWRLPDILTIQLKRFSFRNLLWRDKIDKKVHFPIRGLDLSPYLSHSVASDNAVYDLFAVVNHYGGIISGHYTAYAKCPGSTNSSEDEVGWRCMDDRFVRDIGEQSVVTSAAYLLLYRRRKESPSPSAGSLCSPKYSDPEEID